MMTKEQIEFGIANLKNSNEGLAEQIVCLQMSIADTLVRYDSPITDYDLSVIESRIKRIREYRNEIEQNSAKIRVSEQIINN